MASSFRLLPEPRRRSAASLAHGQASGARTPYPSHSMQYGWPFFSRASWDRCRTRKQE